MEIAGERTNRARMFEAAVSPGTDRVHTIAAVFQDTDMAHMVEAEVRQNTGRAHTYAVRMTVAPVRQNTGRAHTVEAEVLPESGKELQGVAVKCQDIRDAMQSDWEIIGKNVGVLSSLK